MNVNFDYILYHALNRTCEPKIYGGYINEKKRKMRGGYKRR